MILQTIIDLGMGAVIAILKILPAFPSAPEFLMDGINAIFGVMAGGVNFLSFFVRLSTVRLVVPVVLGLIYAEDIYKVCVWVLKKIPFLGID